MAYRLEYASSGRAACKAPEPCKGTKIDKGALRLGTVIEIKDHHSFSWRHWGCVTMKQLDNMKKNIGEAEDVDGYEDLREEDQKRVAYAMEHGRHQVGDVTPGMEETEADGSPKKKKPRKSKKAKEEEDEEAEEAQETEGEKDEEKDYKPPGSKPKKGKASSKKAKAVKNESADEEEDVKPAASKKEANGGAKKRSRAVKEEDVGSSESLEEKKAPAKKRGRAKKEPVSDHDEGELEASTPAPVKKARGRPKKVKSEED